MPCKFEPWQRLRWWLRRPRRRPFLRRLVAELATQATRHPPLHLISTCTPAVTMWQMRDTSQFAVRMQPWLAKVPML